MCVPLHVSDSIPMDVKLFALVCFANYDNQKSYDDYDDNDDKVMMTMTKGKVMAMMTTT